MSKLLIKPSQKPLIDTPAKFQRFYLDENPFPAEPAVNKGSEDRRINGSIYEAEIRSVEYEKILNRFLVQPQSNPNHIRLGYIVDTSYIGRGNGKSAFLVNLQNKINENYCLDMSQGVNKCFALYVTPELGGRTKTFSNFVDCLFRSVMDTGMIENSLATLRLEAILKLHPQKEEILSKIPEDELIENLNDENWFRENGIDINSVSTSVQENEFLQTLPPEFPLSRGKNSLFKVFIRKEDFSRYYLEELKRSKDKLDFMFSHLVAIFLAAGFNGAYVLVDNFEHIPIYQSARQKLDFAFELRSCLFDGSYTSSRLGFFNFFLVFHAGVQRLISEAWSASGMENRSPISSLTVSNHLIEFEKLSAEHVALLLKKYLLAYRKGEPDDDLYPFTMEAINLIGPASEFNASKILRLAYDLLEKLADTPDKDRIDADFVKSLKELQGDDLDKSVPTIEEAESIDLLDKAKKG